MAGTNKLKIKQTAKITCVVTGFGPFYGQPFNPSEIIARSMPPELILPKSKLKVPITSLALSTIGDKCWQQLKPVLERIKANKQACVLVMLGLAARQTHINLERFALNLWDERRPDNNNRIIRNKKLVKSAPEALRTNAPIEDALDHLKLKGWPAEISNYVGTYICGVIFFHALHYFDTNFKKSRLPYSVAFIHVPLPETYGKTLKKEGIKKTKLFSKGKDKQMAAMFEAVKSVVEFNCESLIRQIKTNK